MGQGAFCHTVPMEQFASENGIYRLFCRQGGVLSPRALPLFLEMANRGAEAIYADEAFFGKDGGTESVYKPDDAPQTLLAQPCIGAPLALSQALLERLETEGGESPEALADLALRVQEAGVAFFHIPEVLLHSPKPEPIPYHLLVAVSCRRRGMPALAVEGAVPGSCQLRFGIPAKGDLAVIVPFTGDCHALQKSLAGVERYAMGLKFSCYVPCLQQPAMETSAYFRALEETGRVIILRPPNCTSEAAGKNQAAERAKERLLLFLDAGVEPMDGRALFRLAEWALQPGVGPVGGLLLRPDGRIANAGFYLGENGPQPLLEGRNPREKGRGMERFCRCMRNASAVGGGALMVERERFLAARGFDETMPPAGVDAEFCVRLQRQGLYPLYQPEARFLSNRQNPGPERNNQRMLDAFFSFARQGDPMLSRNPLWQAGDLL